MPSPDDRASAHAHPKKLPALHALIVFGSSWLLPISTERERSMPLSQFYRQVAAALPIQWSRHAQSRLLCCRSCPPTGGAGLFCPGCTFGAIGHAHLAGALARLAQSGAACHHYPAARAQPALAVDAASRPQDRGDFRHQNLLQCHHGLASGAAEAQLVGP
jgi:hypothetical protein